MPAQTASMFLLYNEALPAAPSITHSHASYLTHPNVRPPSALVPQTVVLTKSLFVSTENCSSLSTETTPIPCLILQNFSAKRVSSIFSCIAIPYSRYASPYTTLAGQRTSSLMSTCVRLVTRQCWAGLQRAGERFTAAVRPSLGWATMRGRGIKDRCVAF